MNKILCSSGALITRLNNRNYKALIEIADKLDCDGFELMIYNSWYEKLSLIINDFKASGLCFPVIHVDKLIGELLSQNLEGNLKTALISFEKNCEAAVTLNAKLLVLHLWGGIASDKQISFNFECYPILNAIAQKYGLLLTVENVVCNQQNPLKHLNTLHELYKDISFTFDTKMAEFHKELELIYKPEWQWLFDGGCIRHLHINDYDGGYMDFRNLKVSHLEAGHANLTAFFDYINCKGYTGDFTVEATSVNPDGSIDTASLNRDFAFIREHFTALKQVLH